MVVTRIAKTGLICLATAALISACGKKSGSGGGGGSDCPAGTQCDFRVGDKDSKEYYKQFTYQVLGDCKNKSTIQFVYFGTKGGISIGEDRLGRPVEASIIMTLNADGTYEGEYREDALTRISGSVSQTDRIYSQAIEGRWSVNQTNIVIEGLGTGSGYQYTYNQSTEQRVLLKANSPQLSKLNGKTLDMGRIISNISASGESIHQYCSARP